MIIRNKKHRKILFLFSERESRLNCADIIAKVRRAGWLDPGENDFFLQGNETLYRSEMLLEELLHRGIRLETVLFVVESVPLILFDEIRYIDSARFERI